MFILKLIKRFLRLGRYCFIYFFEYLLIPVYLILSCLSRMSHRNKVGLGPEPLINNVHHKKALLLNGIQAETFVKNVYYITKDFDHIVSGPISSYIFFVYMLFCYKAIFIYFNGNILHFACINKLLKYFEPLFYKIAGIKIIVMPYGGDVQSFDYYNDVVYKSAYISDYPFNVNYNSSRAKKNIKFWIKHGDWIISGCDWAQYLPYWDTLMLAHFSIDKNKWFPINDTLPDRFDNTRPLRILHAPNHKAIKGTYIIEKIIDELKSKNYPIEYLLVQKIPNNEFVPFVQNADIVIDQLVIGWYGLFALEAMACKKPVLIYISPRLEKLYVMAGLLEIDELPFVKVDYNTLKQSIIDIIKNPSKIRDIGIKAQNFVEKHHSLEYIGGVFKDILEKVEGKK